MYPCSNWSRRLRPSRSPCRHHTSHHLLHLRTLHIQKHQLQKYLQPSTQCQRNLRHSLCLHHQECSYHPLHFPKLHLDIHHCLRSLPSKHRPRPRLLQLLNDLLIGKDISVCLLRHPLRLLLVWYLRYQDCRHRWIHLPLLFLALRRRHTTPRLA